MLSIDTKLQRRKYQLRKVKVIEVFFVEFRVNFSKFNTQNPMQSLSASAQWNLQKIFMFLCIYISSLFHFIISELFPQFYFQITVLRSIKWFRTFVFQKLLLRSVRQFQDILLPEIVIQSVRQFSGHFQKLLSQSVRWFSGHFTSRNFNPFHQMVQGILLLTYHYYIYVMLLYDYSNYFVFSLRISYYICVIQLLLLLIVFCSLYHCL